MNAEPEAKTLSSLQSAAEQLAASYTPPPTGRPSAIGDGDTVKELLTQLASGNRRDVACDLAGISKQTFYNWLKKAEADPETLEGALLTLIKRAESQAEARIVGNVLKASEKEQFWAAGMTYLERKHPEHWGRRQDSEQGPKVVVQIGIQASDVSVSILSPSSPQQLACGNQGQTDIVSLINGDYVTPAENP